MRGRGRGGGVRGRRELTHACMHMQARGALLARNGDCASDVGDRDGVVHAAMRQQSGVLVERLGDAGREIVGSYSAGNAACGLVKCPQQTVLLCCCGGERSECCGV